MQKVAAFLTGLATVTSLLAIPSVNAAIPPSEDPFGCPSGDICFSGNIAPIDPEAEVPVEDKIVECMEVPITPRSIDNNTDDTFALFEGGSGCDASNHIGTIAPHSVYVVPDDGSGVGLVMCRGTKSGSAQRGWHSTPNISLVLMLA
jgi:hypothetical protein